MSGRSDWCIRGHHDACRFDGCSCDCGAHIPHGVRENAYNGASTKRSPSRVLGGPQLGLLATNLLTQKGA